MHDQVSEILGHDVVGEVTRVESSFFDVGLGRLCLDTLDPDQIENLVDRLRRAFPHQVTIRRSLGPYLLQISARPLFAYYERRFMLKPAVLGDLWGTLCFGLVVLVRQGEAPLRTLSGFDALLTQHRQHLDTVVRAARDGIDVDVGPLVASMVEPMRRAWHLVPSPQRRLIRPLSRFPDGRILPCDPAPRRTVLLSVDLWDGTVHHQHVYQHTPYEKHDEALGWMSEVYAAMREAYPPPRHAAAMARASSVERFVEAFPGFQRIVGTVLEAGGGQ
jgi:hypothetical protein